MGTVDTFAEQEAEVPMAVVARRTMLDRREDAGEAAPRRGSHTVPEMSQIWWFLPREISFLFNILNSYDVL